MKKDKILIELLEQVSEDATIIPEELLDEYEAFYEGITMDMLKDLLPKSVRKKIAHVAHKEKYKIALDLYKQIKNDKNRKMSDHMAMVTAAELVGLNPRELLDVMKTRREENQNGQKYLKPSIKPTGKVLEDGLPETTKAYCDMTPGQTYEEIMSIISEKAPPDKDIENWIKKNKERFIDRYGEEDYAEYLYGRAWNMFNKRKGITECRIQRFKDFIK